MPNLMVVKDMCKLLSESQHQTTQKGWTAACYVNSQTYRLLTTVPTRLSTLVGLNCKSGHVYPVTCRQCAWEGDEQPEKTNSSSPQSANACC